jgi:hypothetical protein
MENLMISEEDWSCSLVIGMFSSPLLSQSSLFFKVFVDFRFCGSASCLNWCDKIDRLDNVHMLSERKAVTKFTVVSSLIYHVPTENDHSETERDLLLHDILISNYNIVAFSSLGSLADLGATLSPSWRGDFPKFISSFWLVMLSSSALLHVILGITVISATLRIRSVYLNLTYASNFMFPPYCKYISIKTSYLCK